VHVLPARRAGALAGAGDLLLALAVPADAVSGAANAPEFLDVDMDQLARRATLVAVGRLDRRQA
jgi:hypothetical protein